MTESALDSIVVAFPYGKPVSTFPENALMRTSEPKPHYISKLPVSFDSEARERGCLKLMRTTERQRHIIPSAPARKGSAPPPGAAPTGHAVQWQTTLPYAFLPRAA